MAYTLNSLAASLQQLPQDQALVLGLSGGLDSLVLLHSLVELRAQDRLGRRLRAIHVNHGLQVDAEAVARQCAALCEGHAVELEVADVGAELRATQNSEASLENRARNARYGVFEASLKVDEVLLLAHHLDDQAETMLLRLMRGAGIKGLRAIPPRRALGKGSLLRPLLETSRAELVAYAEAQQLQWQEDLSNADVQFDRNFLRHEIMPHLESRWPGYRESLSKTATLATEADALLDELAAQDLIGCATPQPSVLNVTALQAMSAARQRNLLRVWLRGLGVTDLGWNRLQSLSRDLLQAPVASGAGMIAEAYQLRRFQDCLYALHPLPQFDASARLSLQLDTNSQMPLVDNGTLRVLQGECLAELAELHIRYRQGGESCQFAGRPTKTLKKLLQEQALEPWYRDRVPMLYAGDRLICIADVGVVAGIAAEGTGVDDLLVWERPQFALGEA